MLSIQFYAMPADIAATIIAAAPCHAYACRVAQRLMPKISLLIFILLFDIFFTTLSIHEISHLHHHTHITHAI